MKPIIEIDVSDKPTQELQSMRNMFELQCYSTCIQVYEGLVDTYILEVYE